MENTVIMIFEDLSKNRSLDIEAPLNISANELIYGLNKGLHLGIDINNVRKCYLCTREPRILLRGDKTLEELGVRNGTIITYRG